MTRGTPRLGARLLTWLLGVLTCVLLVATVGLALGQWRTSPVAADVVQVGPVLSRAGVTVRLPPSFAPLDPRERLFYSDRQGRPLAAVSRAALLSPGACADPGSHRGFVGFSSVSRASLAAAHEREVRRWSRALRVGVGAGPRAAPLARAGDRLRTDLWVDVAARLRGTLPCQPPEVRASVVTLPGEGGRVVTVVLVRDIGAPGALGGPGAEVVLDAISR